MKNAYRMAWMLGLLVAISLATAPSAYSKEDSKPQKEKKAKKEKKSEGGHGSQTNAFTRFWIHTVGAPMGRGMKDGMKKVYKNLRSGTHSIKESFMGVGGYKKGSKGKNAKGGDDKNSVNSYSNRPGTRTIDWNEYPGLKAALDKYSKANKKTVVASKK